MFGYLISMPTNFSAALNGDTIQMLTDVVMIIRDLCYHALIPFLNTYGPFYLYNVFHNFLCLK